LIERFAVANDLLLGALAVRNVADGTDEPFRQSVGVDDQAAQDQPVRGVRGRARANLELEPAPLPGEAALEVLLQRREIFRQYLVKESGDRLSAVAVPELENLMETRREIRPIGGDVPVPQADIRTPGGKGVAFLAFPQPRLGCLQFGYVVNRADKAHGPSGLVADRLGALVDDADLAVGTQDAILHVDRPAAIPGDGIRVRESLPVVGMDALQVLSMGP